MFLFVLFVFQVGEWLNKIEQPLYLYYTVSGYRTELAASTQQLAHFTDTHQTKMTYL